MNIEVEVYWHDLSEYMQQELLRAGYDNTNIIDGVFPITVIYMEGDDK